MFQEEVSGSSFHICSVSSLLLLDAGISECNDTAATFLYAVSLPPAEQLVSAEGIILTAMSEIARPQSPEPEAFTARELGLCCGTLHNG